MELIKHLESKCYYFLLVCPKGQEELLLYKYYFLFGETLNFLTTLGEARV